MGKTRADRYCTVCGDHYLYCRCQEYSHMEPWHDAYDTENCKNLYNITAGWINGWLDKEVEIARLNKCDLSKMDKFPQWMQDTIKEMQNYKPDVSLDAVEKVMEDTYVIKTAEVNVEEPVMDETKVEDKKAVHDFTKNGYKKIKPKYNK